MAPSAGAPSRDSQAQLNDMGNGGSTDAPVNAAVDAKGDRRCLQRFYARCVCRPPAAAHQLQARGQHLIPCVVQANIDVQLPETLYFLKKFL